MISVGRVGVEEALFGATQSMRLGACFAEVGVATLFFGITSASVTSRLNISISRLRRDVLVKIWRSSSPVTPRVDTLLNDRITSPGNKYPRNGLCSCTANTLAPSSVVSSVMPKRPGGAISRRELISDRSDEELVVDNVAAASASLALVGRELLCCTTSMACVVAVDGYSCARFRGIAG